MRAGRRPAWMARPSSQDLRERMMWAVLSGQSRHEVARMFDVSASCVIKLMQRVDATGDCQPRKFGGHKRYALAEHEDKVRAHVVEKPDLTITELWQKITSQGIKVGRSDVTRFLLHLQLPFKNVWPAPSASDFVKYVFVQSASTYPASGSCPRPRWRSARPGPHK